MSSRGNRKAKRRRFLAQPMSAVILAAPCKCGCSVWQGRQEMARPDFAWTCASCGFTIRASNSEKIIRIKSLSKFGQVGNGFCQICGRMSQAGWCSECRNTSIFDEELQREAMKQLQQQMLMDKETMLRQQFQNAHFWAAREHLRRNEF